MWSTTTGAPTTPSKTSFTPSATPISCANFRRSASSTRSLGPRPCARRFWTPTRPCKRPRRRAPRRSPPETIKAFEDRYWTAVREGLALHRSLPAFDPSTNPKKRKKQRPAHNLLIRFKTFKEATLRFLTDFTVPFTNNLAERDLRMMKVKIKISGGFRTLQGAADFASLRSVISSARKQGLDILKALTLDRDRLTVELKL